MPAASPTLSPTLSAMVAGLRGSSSGMLASTFPTRSAPMSAALVNIPPPIRMNRAIRLAPIPTPAMVMGSGKTRYSPVMASSAIAGMVSPTVAPPRNAMAKVFPRPSPLRLAARTAALTVIFRDISPATAESVAPTAKAIPLEKFRRAPMTTASPMATGTMIFISRFRKAAAPTPDRLGYLHHLRRAGVLPGYPRCQGHRHQD